ncbi:MAG: LapA family protein [Gammaproteobacteria bacterium]|nr:LapA family protein [Gammaproteobacteria bacterium]MCY4211099.1 LapA family protein [Gammaproteobacteria bacterium]MCY4282982.1 LapA family protein [Gammaproteobacteria bacterium]MCY4339249.1 LapA family protein [Gammaproteobacteria bacterium]
MFYVKLTLALCIVLAGLAFHVRNAQPVVIDFYLASYEIPMSLLVAVALLIGALLGVLASLPARLKLQRDKARLGRELKKLQPQGQDPSVDDAD